MKTETGEGVEPLIKLTVIDRAARQSELPQKRTKNPKKYLRVAVQNAEKSLAGIFVAEKLKPFCIQFREDEANPEAVLRAKELQG